MMIDIIDLLPGVEFAEGVTIHAQRNPFLLSTNSYIYSNFLPCMVWVKEDKTGCGLPLFYHKINNADYRSYDSQELNEPYNIDLFGE